MTSKNMDETPRSLWQLLLLKRKSKEAFSLTCEECFALLEYDADRLVAGVDPDEIRPSVWQDLALCSNCLPQIDNWLARLDMN
jgi:hypothetical protein